MKSGSRKVDTPELVPDFSHEESILLGRVGQRKPFILRNISGHTSLNVSVCPIETPDGLLGFLDNPIPFIPGKSEVALETNITRVGLFGVVDFLHVKSANVEDFMRKRLIQVLVSYQNIHGDWFEMKSDLEVTGFHKSVRVAGIQYTNKEAPPRYPKAKEAPLHPSNPVQSNRPINTMDGVVPPARAVILKNKMKASRAKVPKAKAPKKKLTKSRTGRSKA